MKKINMIPYDANEKFPQYCRLRTLEEGSIIIENVNHSDLEPFLEKFGRIVPQHDGQAIFDVKPSEELGKIYYSRTMSEVPPHTDGHDMPTPPHFFLLYCVEPSEKGDGTTEISSSIDILKALSNEETTLLMSKSFSYKTKPSSQIMDADEVQAKIYDQQKNIFRYSYNYLSSQSKSNGTQNLIEKIKEIHNKNKLSIALKKGDLLICENHHVLHSRSEFSGKRRHLIRAWVD